MVLRHHSICDGFLAKRGYKIVVDNSDRLPSPVEIEDKLLFVQGFWTSARTILVPDDTKNGPQLRIGFINELLSEWISVRVDHAPGSFSAGSQFFSYVGMPHFGGLH
jgi:hypothetical protein